MSGNGVDGEMDNAENCADEDEEEDADGIVKRRSDVLPMISRSNIRECPSLVVLELRVAMTSTVVVLDGCTGHMRKNR